MGINFCTQESCTNILKIFSIGMEGAVYHSSCSKKQLVQRIAAKAAGTASYWLTAKAVGPANGYTKAEGPASRCKSSGSSKLLQKQQVQQVVAKAVSPASCHKNSR
jgi:hypothetical protein